MVRVEKEGGGGGAGKGSAVSGGGITSVAPSISRLFEEGWWSENEDRWSLSPLSWVLILQMSLDSLSFLQVFRQLYRVATIRQARRTARQAPKREPRFWLN